MWRTTALLIVAIGAVAVLGGCSGAGAPPADVRGASVQTLASDQVSAIALFGAWSKMLYVKASGQMTGGQPVPQPDGSVWIDGTNSDGSVFHWVIDNGSLEFSPGHGTITWPDGTTYSSEWDATDMAPDYSHSTDHIRDTFPNGARLECTIVNNYSAQTQSLWDGTATTKGGITMTFHLDRVQGGRDRLTLTLPDGAVMAFEVPLIDGLNYYWPAFSRGASGTYKRAGGPTLQFALTGTERWNQWALTAPDGTEGAFTLDADLLGQGQLTRAGVTLGALRWWTEIDGKWTGSLNLLGSGQQSVTPSAAARDFQINRWIANGAAMGPSPMY